MLSVVGPVIFVDTNGRFVSTSSILLVGASLIAFSIWDERLSLFKLRSKLTSFGELSLFRLGEGLPVDRSVLLDDPVTASAYDSPGVRPVFLDTVGDFGFGVFGGGDV